MSSPRDRAVRLKGIDVLSDQAILEALPTLTHTARFLSVTGAFPVPCKFIAEYKRRLSEGARSGPGKFTGTLGRANTPGGV